jgi:hypothetical protein
MIRNISRFAQGCEMSMRCVGIASFVLILAFGLAAPAEAQKIITFDAPGADLNPADANGTFASGINNFGVIVGSFVDANNVNHSFLRFPDGKFVTFDVPAADQTPGSFNGTAAQAINDAGVVAGSYFDASGEGHGFLRSAEGKITTFDAPSSGGSGTTPIALNLEGAVVGFYMNTDLVFRAFLRSPNGKITTFAGPHACALPTSDNCFGNEASNINVFGTVAGNFEDNSANFVGHGMIRHPDGSIVAFEAPGAGSGSGDGTGCPGCFAGLNIWGTTAATFTDSSNTNHGYIRNPDGKIITFDAPGAGTGNFIGTGCPSDCAVGLNDFGWITGTYIDANFTFHGYLRNPEGKIVTVDPAGSAGTEANAINDAGIVTGLYIDANSVFHGFLRLP